MKLHDHANIHVAATSPDHDDGARDPDAVGGSAPASAWERRAARSRRLLAVHRALRHAHANTAASIYAFPKRGPKR